MVWTSTRHVIQDGKIRGMRCIGRREMVTRKSARGCTSQARLAVQTTQQLPIQRSWALTLTPALRMGQWPFTGLAGRDSSVSESVQICCNPLHRRGTLCRIRNELFCVPLTSCNVYNYGIYGWVCTATCRWLRDVGCNWRKVNDWGCNAAHWAALQGNLPMCRWLRRIGERLT